MKKRELTPEEKQMEIVKEQYECLLWDYKIMLECGEQTDGAFEYVYDYENQNHIYVSEDLEVYCSIKAHDDWEENILNKMCKLWYELER